MDKNLLPKDEHLKSSGVTDKRMNSKILALLVFVTCAYITVGALIFRALEGAHEENRLREFEQFKNSLFGECTRFSEFMLFSDFSILTFVGITGMCDLQIHGIIV